MRNGIGNSINRAQIKKNMMDFCKRNMGKSVLFASLNAKDRYNYIMIKPFTHFTNFLNPTEALTRAIDNAEAHKSMKYERFLKNPNEHMIIGE